MQAVIQKHLAELEAKENIRILFAIESGSRAWGFASPDSDYDVRFIYVRPVTEYLKLEKRRDVIEYMLTGELDINGWDLDKALKLMRLSNPTFFEWCNSPIVYQQTDFLQKLNRIKDKYFYGKAGLHHYLNMAGRNYREYLKGDEVRLKKYFYVLRPLLACAWILKEGAPPPMLFKELLADLPHNLRVIVDGLLDMKMNNPEIAQGKKMVELNDWIEAEIKTIEAQLAKLPAEKKPDWQELDELFLAEVMA
ncbi:MAG: nucleotidyltransferase domain-containing protein [Zoogloeaceae bacterium]|nr:nucleotidyltransferase domain-containing protein [Zoogloeaceae bacterium]